MHLKHGTKNPVVMGGQPIENGASQGYSAQSEMVKAMSDPRYGRDRAYTMEVQRKTQTAKFLKG